MRKVLFCLALFFLCHYMAMAQSNEGQVKDIQVEKVYDVVEMPPAFPGGQAELLKFLSAQVRYPKEAIEQGIQGRVIVKFIVEKDGSISNVEVLRGVDPLLDKEAVRVVSSMPIWRPGRYNGQNVRVRYNVPVNFRLPKKV